MEKHQGALLKALVQYSGMSREEVAEKMGYSANHLSRLYNNEKLTPKAVKAAMELFQVEKSYFCQRLSKIKQNCLK